MSKAIKCLVHPTKLVPSTGGMLSASPYLAHLTRAQVLECLFNDSRVFRISADGTSSEEIQIDDVMTDSETGEDIFAKPQVIAKVDTTVKPETSVVIRAPKGTEKKVIVKVDEPKEKKKVVAETKIEE